MSFLKTLSREQKEAIGLLQIGTFLEYFDLMIYVHMAVILNELFFPKTNPHTAFWLHRRYNWSQDNRNHYYDDDGNFLYYHG